MTRFAYLWTIMALGIGYPVGFGAASLSKVSLATSLPNNQARPGQRFLVTGGAHYCGSVVFSFYAATTTVRPVQAVHMERRNDCSSGCTSQTVLTAPQSRRTLYLWLEVTTTTESEERSLTIIVVGNSSQEKTLACPSHLGRKETAT